MHRWKIIILLVLSLFLLSFSPLQESETSVIHAVFFYSPSCPHCHDVIENVFPELVEQYGSQLLILGVNTQTIEGQELYQATIEHFELPDDRLGVPALIVGETQLLGSDEIPEQFPGIIEQGLEQGGIPWPSIPNFDQVVNISFAAKTQQASSASQGGDVVISQTNAGSSFGDLSMWQKFQRDLVGNSLAVVVMIGSVVSVIINIWRSEKKPSRETPWLKWAIPVLAVIGLGIAGYLSYVEITQTEAVCGPVGDCNTVQQSPYATLFNVLPVGLFGLIGYIGILIAWALQYYGPEKFRPLAIQAVWGMALFGTLYSIYLTYLEPFVIGATCAWCLSSAIVITLILWASTEPVRDL